MSLLKLRVGMYIGRIMLIIKIGMVKVSEILNVECYLWILWVLVKDLSCVLLFCLFVMRVLRLCVFIVLIMLCSLIMLGW